MLVITFDKNRKILYDLWLEITETIDRNYQKYCQVNYTIFSEERLAIEMRCRVHALDALASEGQKGGPKSFFEMLTIFNEDIAVMKLGNGIKGIKKVFKKNENELVEQPNG